MLNCNLSAESTVFGVDSVFRSGGPIFMVRPFGNTIPRDEL
jgi:hypothetical protein